MLGRLTSRRQLDKFLVRKLSSIPLIINGEDIFTNKTYHVKSHSTDQPLHSVQSIDENFEGLSRICQISQKGFEIWSEVNYEEKTKILSSVKQQVIERRDELIQAHTEIGVPGWFSGFNVDGSIGQLQEYINQLSRPEGLVPQSSNDLALVLRQPIGPVLSIAPWNAPGILGMRSLAAPLSAGCSVILKSSEMSSRISYLLAKCFLDGGVPEEAVQLINSSATDTPGVISRLIGDPNIRKINFTGSSRVGAKLAAIAGSHLKPILLELGGKNSVIIDKDANLDAAIGNTLWSGWAHKGQICMSTEKVYIMEEIYDEAVEKLKIIGSDMISNDPDLLLQQRDLTYKTKIDMLLQDALKKGANIVVGDILDSNVVGPIVLKDVTSDMDIYSTETFGPIFFIDKITSMEEGVKLANESEYGLKTSIWSSNHLNALKYARKINSGGVHINGSTVNDEATLPHGGTKISGYGRFNSSWGIDEFSYVKTITLSQ